MNLRTYLRAATPDERQLTADLAQTSVNYLYQIAGGHRGKRAGIDPGRAIDIEQATAEVARDSGGRLQPVDRCSLSPFFERYAEYLCGEVRHADGGENRKEHESGRTEVSA